MLAPTRTSWFADRTDICVFYSRPAPGAVGKLRRNDADAVLTQRVLREQAHTPIAIVASDLARCAVVSP